MTPVYVRKCACGHYYVGDKGCPKCGAQWLLTSLIMICDSRKMARIVAEDCRANGQRAVEFHKYRRYDITDRILGRQKTFWRVDQ